MKTYAVIEFKTYDRIDRIYRHLSALKDELASGCSRRDRAVVLIGACIVQGFDTSYEILKALGSLGLSKKHVRGLLEEREGAVVGVHLWNRDGDGRYHLLDPA